MRLVLPLALLLAACGVDGPPVPPSQAEDDVQGPRILVTGSASVGVGRRF